MKSQGEGGLNNNYDFEFFVNQVEFEVGLVSSDLEFP